MSNDDFVHCHMDAEIVQYTSKAILFDRGSDGSIWIPFSQLASVCLKDGGDTSDFMNLPLGRDVESIEVVEWLADKHDLERFEE